MSPLCVWAILFLSSCQVALGLFGHENEAENMVSNWGFEDALSNDDWRIRSADVVRQQQDVHTGSWAVEIANRFNKKAGVYQFINFGNGPNELKTDSLYYLSCFIKLKSNSTESRYTLPRYFYKIYYTDPSLNAQHELGRLKFVQADGIWRQLGGDLETPPASDSPVKIEVYMWLEPDSVPYYLDTFALTEIPRMADWRQELDQQILSVRRRTIKLRVRKSGGLPANVRAEVQHERHHYLFGTSVKPSYLYDSCQTTVCINYRQFIKDNFNIIVCENDMKWLSMERTENTIRYGPGDEALAWARANDMKFRGHTMLWEMESRNPSWLLDESQTPDMITDNLMRRVRYMAEHYKVDQWDVCNEYLNGHTYEKATGRDDLIVEEFNLAHSIDPNAALCINDYLIARAGGILTSAQMGLAKYLQLKNAHIGCIGLLGHLRQVPIFPERLKKRLEILSDPDLPIMVTEFSIHGNDEAAKVEAMEQAMKVYFSEPKVAGMTLWGFSTLPGLSFEASSAVTDGEDFVPNAMGQVMFNLINVEWKTQFTFNPTSNSDRKTVDAFHGQYSAKIYVDDQLVKTAEFDVNQGTGNQYITINI